MASLAEQYERIERYLQGGMTPGERNAFQQKLDTDPELASAVNLHQELTETLAGERIHKFRKTLKEVDANWKPATGGKWLRILKRPQNLAIAASLLLLIGFFGWWRLQTPSNLELVAQHFEQLPVLASMGLDSEGAQLLRKEAHQAYIDEDYALAIEKFQELSRLAPEDLSCQLYLGISQLGVERAKDASTTLKILADGNDQSVNQEAAWYLALAYLQLDDGEAAKIYLQRLVQNQGYQAEKAQDLINVLK